MIYYVYKMTNGKNGTLYIGITNNLVKRIYEHKNEFADSFTKKHQIKRLVYFETTEDIITAIKREKRLKNWKRDWKIHLIEKHNPEWKDLYPEILK